MKISDILAEQTITAYHGTGRRFDQFQQSTISGNYFTQDPEYAKGYLGKTGPMFGTKFGDGKRGRNYLITVALSINHPFDTKNDPGAVQFYNEQFLPNINTIFAKYNRPQAPPIEPGKWVSFVWADDLYRHFMHYGAQGYDAIYVDEGGFSPVHPAIVPLNASQIKILKRQIIK